MWPNVPICRSKPRAVSAMNPTISASSLRGTVTSSRIVVGRRRASAEKALRRAAASASASASSRATRTSRARCVARDRRHALRFVGHGRRMAVGFHQQHGGAVGRQADVRVLLDAARRHLIQELERAGDDPRRDDRRHRLGGILDAIVERQHGPPRGRARHELQQHFGDDPERALRPDEQILHRVAGDVLHALAAEPRDPAVGQHDLERHHVVARHAVLQSAKPAGVLGDVAADGADAHRTRIGRVEQPVTRRRLVDRLRDDARPARAA